MKIRRARPEDARAIAEMYRRSVHELADKAYDEEILEAWARPVDEESIERSAENLDRQKDGATAFVAIDGDRVLGFTDVNPAEEYLRAVYVDPEMAGRGLGTALLRQSEWVATQAGAERLTLKSSLNAVGFYEKNGYERLEEGTHELGEDLEMACVHMAKTFPGG